MKLSILTIFFCVLLFSLLSMATIWWWKDIQREKSILLAKEDLHRIVKAAQLLSTRVTQDRSQGFWQLIGKESPLNDPLGNAYFEVTMEKSGITVSGWSSLGPDGKVNTADDLFQATRHIEPFDLTRSDLDSPLKATTAK